MIGSFLALLTCVAAAAATRSLTVKVSAPDVVWNVDHFYVLTTIVNTGDETLRLLNDPRTPLSSVATNTFVVTNSDGMYPTFNGVKVQYLPHVMARRSGGRPLFTLLDPGESVNVPHEVGRYYNFTSSGPGSYTFIPVNIFNALEDDGSVSVLVADTIPATVHIAGKLCSTEELGPRSLGGVVLGVNERLRKRENFVSCSESQEQLINAATANSSTACSNALNHLQNNPQGSDLETTWFGTFDVTHHQKILTTFQRLAGNFAGWTYDCSCNYDYTFAYVYAPAYGTVYLCLPFWVIDDTSRTDTLIREGTKFQQVADTEDLADGDTDCKELAENKPNDAVRNADSYAFFASEAPGSGGT